MEKKRPSTQTRDVENTRKVINHSKQGGFGRDFPNFRYKGIAAYRVK